MGSDEAKKEPATYLSADRGFDFLECVCLFLAYWCEKRRDGDDGVRTCAGLILLLTCSEAFNRGVVGILAQRDQRMHVPRCRENYTRPHPEFDSATS